MDDLNSITALWWAVIASGIYHGVNPGMGWPLAVSASLMEPNTRAMPRALGMLALGHLLAMLGILLPFSLMIVLVEYEAQIRIVASLMVIGMGVYLLLNRKHPKFLVRVHPARLALWSFLSALAHGAGLMLVPIYLGICAIAPDDTGHIAVQILMGNTIATAITVAIVHSVAMTVAGGSLAVVIHYWLGLRFLSKTWFNLDVVWALSLILVGLVGLWSAL